MNKFIYLSIILFFAIVANADVMHVQTSSGLISIPLQEIESISFSQVSAEAVELRPENIPITLLKNFPNPFNPQTKILFEITESGHVEVEIFNIKGQKVTKLLEKNLSIGQHQVVWNGLDKQGKKAASGVYLYRVTVNQKEKLNKMILLK